MIDNVYFGNISARALGLVFSSMEISPPEPRRTTVVIPGAHGVLDLSHAISEYIIYDERQLQIAFYMKDFKERWADIYPVIMAAIHGKQHHVIMSDDSDWYWDAYCTINSIETQRKFGTVIVNMQCYPYKRKVVETTKTVTLTTGTNTINLANNRMEVTPKITNTAAIAITEWNGTAVSIALAAGTHTLADHVLESGANVIKMTGTGTVTIEYQEGKL